MERLIEIVLNKQDILDSIDILQSIIYNDILDQFIYNDNNIYDYLVEDSHNYQIIDIN